MEWDKLGIRPEFFEQLVSCDWFCNCGDKTFDQFEVYIEDNQEMAVARLNSLVRENACLERRNKRNNAMREVLGGWNHVVKEIQQSGYIGKVSKRIKSGLKKKGRCFRSIYRVICPAGMNGRSSGCIEVAEWFINMRCILQMNIWKKSWRILQRY